MYACWYPVGSPEYRERRAELGSTAAALNVGAGVDAGLVS